MATRKLKGTIAQLTEKTGMKQPQLSQLLKLAKDAGVAEIVGYDASEYKGRGRIPAIYEVAETFNIPVSLKKQKAESKQQEPADHE